VRLGWPDRSLPGALRDALVGHGAPFELVTEDVLGVDMQVFKNRPRDLRDLLVSAADRFGDAPYVVFPDRTLTYASMLEPVAAVARVLSEKYGVAKGDRVAIAAANCAEYAVTFWATTLLGAVTVAMNGWWTGPEMADALALTEPRVLLGDRRRIERLDREAIAPDLPVIVFEDDFASLEAAGSRASLPSETISEDDPFLILFTSGTTGRPKGALHSHRSNIHFIWMTMLRSAEQTARAVADGQGDDGPPTRPCIISASPYFHVSGLNCQLVAACASGMTIVYPPPGKWREDVHLELTERHRATTWSLVPTQLWRLLDWPQLDRYDLSSLRNIGGGSAVWQPELLRTLAVKLPHVRPGLRVGWGMTESNGAGTSLRPDSTYEHPTSIGNAAPTVELEIRDPATGVALGEGAVGEICVRMPALFLRYWNNPEATRAVLDDERWYHTGDFGHVVDELVYLEGRRQDLVIRGGENIYPAEIENRLIEHPDIAEVAVVGVDHPRLGQEVKAYVVRHPGSSLSSTGVREFAAASLASYKVPAYVELVAELPHNSAGKVLKHLLGAGPSAAAGFVEE
jgi:acyl-CoA synthetase (AMP-forming)/AMP-acid ligase II